MYPKRKTVLPDDDITIISADPMFRDLRNQDQVGLFKIIPGPAASGYLRVLDGSVRNFGEARN